MYTTFQYLDCSLTEIKKRLSISSFPIANIHKYSDLQLFYQIKFHGELNFPGADFPETINQSDAARTTF